MKPFVYFCVAPPPDRILCSVVHFLIFLCFFAFLAQVCSDEHVEDNSDENADASFTSVASVAPDDPSPCDARRVLKTLQSYAAKNLLGVAAMDALMKLEICMTPNLVESAVLIVLFQKRTFAHKFLVFFRNRC